MRDSTRRLIKNCQAQRLQRNPATGENMSNTDVTAIDYYKEDKLHVFIVPKDTSTNDVRARNPILIRGKSYEVVIFYSSEKNMIFKCVPYFNENVRRVADYLESKGFTFNGWKESDNGGHSAEYTEQKRVGRVEVLGDSYSIFEMVKSQNIRELEEEQDA